VIESIREREVFAHLSSHGRRGRAGPLTIVRAPHPASDRPAVAFSIRRNVGGAVRRNRLRRQLRAILSELADAGELGDDALLVIVGPHREWPTYTTLREWVRRALAVTG
jgi:ribonuclease P protein component